MSYDKLMAFSMQDLIKLIQLAQKIGEKTKIDYSANLVEKIQDLNNLSVNDIIKEENVKEIFTKKSPVNYRWVIPDE